MATLAEEREAWQDAMLTAAQDGDYAELVRLMANNCGDNGDIESMIDNFVSTCDPAPNWREATS